MPVDQNGNVSRPGAPLPVTGQVADAPQVNVPVNDIYAILNQLVFLDGRKPLKGDLDLNGYKLVGAGPATEGSDLVSLSQVQGLINAIQGVPTGSTIAMTGNQVPAGWVRANGQALNRSTHAALWAYAQASGNLAAAQNTKTHGQYGPGNGSTTFTVPNLEADGGYFIRPLSSGRGIGSVQADAAGPHTHPATFSGAWVPPHAHGVPGRAWRGGDSGTGDHWSGGGSSITTEPAGGFTPSGTVTVSPNSGSETRPKNVAYPVLIKA